MKTLEAFEFDRSGVSAGQLRNLAEGDYVANVEPILLVGEAGQGSASIAGEMPDEVRPGQEKPAWQRDCAWRRVASGGGCGSRQ